MFILAAALVSAFAILFLLHRFKRQETETAFEELITNVNELSQEITALDNVLREMTPAEKEAQRQSFAYGNAKLANPNITREHIEQAANRINGASQSHDQDRDIELDT